MADPTEALVTETNMVAVSVALRQGEEQQQ